MGIGSAYGGKSIGRILIHRHENLRWNFPGQRTPGLWASRGKEFTVTVDCSMYAVKKIEIKLADRISLK